MKILACLGNPDNRYERNRHNAGVIIGRLFARTLDIHLWEKAFSSRLGRGRAGEEKILLLFPQTFMNNSGEAVGAAMRYHDIKPEDLIVLHDEIELPFGEMRVKFGGGHKGHNGLRSIIQHIGSPDFFRLRFGVGRPANSEASVADHVLSDFSSDELEKIESLAPRFNELILSMIRGEKPSNDG